MFQIITPSFLAVALIAAALPYLKASRLKNLVRGISAFMLPIVLAALRRAVDMTLTPCRMLLPITFPPVIFLFGVSRNQLQKALADGNFEIFSPISLTNTNTVL